MHYDSVRKYEPQFPHRQGNSLFTNVLVRHNRGENARRTSTNRCSTRCSGNVKRRCGRMSAITFLVLTFYVADLPFGRP